MQYLIPIAFLFATLAPAVSVLDDSALVQAAAHVHDGSLGSKAEDTAVLEEEAEEELAHGNLTKYGDFLNLTVRPVYGPEFSFSFRSAMRLQVLMHALSAKLGLQLSSTTFTHSGRELDPKSTASAFGIQDKAVIEVSTPTLAAEAAAAKEKAAREAAQLERRRAVQEEEDRKEAVRSEKRRRVAKRVAKVAAEQKRKHNIELKDAISLKFINPNGGENVIMAIKRDNWMDGYLELVAKRLGIDRSKTRFLFKDDENALTEIEPHDSVKTLGLQDEEEIVVKVSHKQ
uniref:Ubiquitin-like domain-containing protein n=1 Tax=Alexandrium monilatum TaxID=311494 RepID=A0A7S4VF13_9DINO